MGSVEEMVTQVSPPRQGIFGGSAQGYHAVGMQAGSTSRMRRLQRQLSFPLRWNQRARKLGLVVAVFLLLVVCTLWISQTASATHIANLASGYYFLSVGDFGTAAPEQFAVARQMGETAASYKAKFVVGLGDNFYLSGITSLDDPQIKEKFESVYTQPALQVPWYVALGDHDQRGNVATQVAYTNVSSIWKMPNPYFVKQIRSRAGDHTLDLIFTDSVGLEGGILRKKEKRRFQQDYNESFAGEKAGRAQLDWLKQVLQQSKADWKIVVGHRPLWSCAHRDRHPVEYRLHETLMPLLTRYGVHAYVHGHDHIGQHSVRGGLHHFGNGVGGYDTHNASMDPSTIWFNNTYHGFMLHHVTAKQLEFMFMDQNGTLLHKVVITQNSRHEEPSLRR